MTIDLRLVDHRRPPGRQRAGRAGADDQDPGERRADQRVAHGRHVRRQGRSPRPRRDDRGRIGDRPAVTRAPGSADADAPVALGDGAARHVRRSTRSAISATKADAGPGRLTLDDLAFQIFGGTFRGRLGADTSGAVPALRLNGQVAGLDVTQVLKGSGAPGGLTGRLGASLAVQGSGADAARLMKTSRGTISAVVADGGTLPAPRHGAPPRPRVRQAVGRAARRSGHRVQDAGWRHSCSPTPASRPTA